MNSVSDDEIDRLPGLIRGAPGHESLDRSKQKRWRDMQLLIARQAIFREGVQRQEGSSSSEGCLQCFTRRQQATLHQSTVMMTHILQFDLGNASILQSEDSSSCK